MYTFENVEVGMFFKLKILEDSMIAIIITTTEEYLIIMLARRQDIYLYRRKKWPTINLVKITWKEFLDLEPISADPPSFCKSSDLLKIIEEIKDKETTDLESGIYKVAVEDLARNRKSFTFSCGN